MPRTLAFFIGIVLGVALLGCGSSTRGNIGNMPMYKIPIEEADWIRNGDPLVFEDEPWYPQDAINILLDSEVTLAGEYQGVQVFVDKVDVRPYDRIYTKFAKNKFRIYKKTNDQNKPAR